MGDLKAKVQNGRLVLDQPTELPEGTELQLVVDDAGDTLGPEERAQLDAAIAKSWESAKAGDVVPIDDVLAELRDRR